MVTTSGRIIPFYLKATLTIFRAFWRVFHDSVSDYSWWSITDHLLLGDSWTRIDDRWSAFAASWPALLYQQPSPMPYATVFLWFGRSWSQVSDAPCYEEYVVHWFRLSVSFHIVCWYNWSTLATWDQLKNTIRANIYSTLRPDQATDKWSCSSVDLILVATHSALPVSCLATVSIL